VLLVGPYYTEDERRFREEVRHWLNLNLDADVVARRGEPEPGKEDQWVAVQREWDRRLYAGGFAGLAWPKEYGGRGATVIEQVIFAEEAARARAPHGLNHIGRLLVGPPIMRHGTEAQKRRFLLPMLKGEEVWCQGFSEPDAGSDLASLQTSAELEGDHYIITGRKIWTTVAQYADWMMLLARTDPFAPKHRGITAFLVDLHSPGIEVRPIRQLSGASGFNEEFFDHVRVPKDNVLGPLNEGWDVALTTLGYERSTLNAGRHLASIQLLHDAVARYGGALDDASPGSALLLERLGRAYAASRALSYLQTRYVSRWAGGARPGPESSVLRLSWAHSYHQTASFILDLLGPRGLIPEGDEAIQGGDWLYLFYESRSRTIAAGTAEIQKNIIAERVLGLPR
jgi:alkylation response protein AidB-like acyl-CoA dehydrogenase